MAGSFTVQFSNLITVTGGRGSGIGTTGWQRTFNSEGDNASLIAGLNNLGTAYIAVPNTGTLTGSIVFGFDMSDVTFSLDGNPPISFNDLPAGFTITDWFWEIDGNSNFAGTVALTISDGILSRSPQSTPSPVEWDSTQGPISNIDFISLEFTIDFSLDTTFGGPDPLIDILDGLAISSGGGYIGGDYTIQSSFDFTLDKDAQPIQMGTHVSVITPGPSDPQSLDPTQILTLEMHYLDSSHTPQVIDIPMIDWVTITLFLFEFIIPALTPDNPPVIELFITSTQFSGSVSLGKLSTIYLINAPGIYTLVDGVTFDTLYDVTNGGTITVKIPDPFAKTGFIGG
jgi:hypothetical protein